VKLTIDLLAVLRIICSGLGPETDYSGKGGRDNPLQTISGVMPRIREFSFPCTVVPIDYSRINTLFGIVQYLSGRTRR
jgi:hypothetical protein